MSSKDGLTMVSIYGTPETRAASPSHFLLKVDSLYLLACHGIYKYESGEFDAGGYKWKLTLDFNGEKHGKYNNDISAYLAISNTASLPANWEVNAVFSIFLLNQITGDYHYATGTRRFMSVKSEWGFPKFITKSALSVSFNGFIVNNNCVFGVEVFVIRNTAAFQSLLLKDVAVPDKSHSKISNFSKVGDISSSKQFVLVDDGSKGEVCLPTKRKGRYEVNGCLELCKFLLEAMRLKAKDQKNDELEHHNAKEGAILETREASPTHFLMKVESFPLLGKHGIQKLVTGFFGAGGYKWRLIICPNEDKIGVDSDYISVYLGISDQTSLKTANWEVNVVFSFFLFDHISGNYHYSLGRTRRFDAIKSEWGISNFISKKALMDPSNGFLIDNKCVFGAEVFVVEKTTVTEYLSVKDVTDPYKRNWKISNFSDLGNIWTSEQFSAEGLTWEVLLYPNGKCSEEGRYASAYLRLIDSKRVKATFSIRIRDQFDREHLRIKSSNWFPSNSKKGWGSIRFVDLDTLHDPKKGFIVKDRCLLEIEINVEAVI